MSADRWAAVDRIYHAALEADAGEREAFLVEACAGDEVLLRDIRSLLAYEPAATAFLERPALEVAAKGLSGDRPPGDWQLAGYQILALIGSGGMGDVYRARDSQLGREVALKVLARSAAGGSASLRRFEDEARMASILNHPNIVTIYGVGGEGDFAYIAMEFVRGRTLREALGAEPLAIQSALDLAVQLADALVAAHASGIVHRDLKPENLMVTPDGLLKVLDFGIAKRQGGGNGEATASAADVRPAAAVDTHTDSGTILGTVGYMSPEQAAGRPVQPASDQFSFGAILYEILSSRRAFKRSTRAATIEAILHEEPEPIENLHARVKEPLRALLVRCLAKDPADRYADTRDLAAQLHRIRSQWERDETVLGLTRRRAVWFGGAAAVVAAAGLASWQLWPRDPGARSIAVLPFANALKDEDVEYLCDGITESLIRGIAGLPSLTVKPRSAVFNFKGKSIDPRDAGRKLAADAVVIGTVTRRSGRLRITAELVDVATGARLWSNTYDRAATEVLSIQDLIASAIIDEGIRLRLTSDQRRRLLRKPTNDPAAFELYLRAIQAFEKETEADYLGARALLRQAVARDQSFALAYVALATTYSLMAVDGYERPADTWPEVSQNVRRAFDWDPDLPDAHSEAATALFFSQWDWPGAEREWNRALQSRGGGFVPDFLSARAIQSWALGRPDEALALIRKARELDPLSFKLIVREADYLFQTGQLENAAGLYESVIRAEPGASNAYFGLAEVRRAQGRFDEAIEARRRGYAAAGDDSLTKVFSTARGAEGYREVEKAAARLELEGLETRAATGYASPLDFARAHARLGEKDRAFGFFPAAFADLASGLVFLKVDHAWDAIRDDPRFLAAVHRVGLP